MTVAHTYIGMGDPIAMVVAEFFGKNCPYETVHVKS